MCPLSKIQNPKNILCGGYRIMGFIERDREESAFEEERDGIHVSDEQREKWERDGLKKQRQR